MCIESFAFNLRTHNLSIRNGNRNEGNYRKHRDNNKCISFIFNWLAWLKCFFFGANGLTLKWITAQKRFHINWICSREIHFGIAQFFSQFTIYSSLLSVSSKSRYFHNLLFFITKFLAIVKISLFNSQHTDRKWMLGRFCHFGKLSFNKLISFKSNIILLFFDNSMDRSLIYWFIKVTQLHKLYMHNEFHTQHLCWTSFVRINQLIKYELQFLLLFLTVEENTKQVIKTKIPNSFFYLHSRRRVRKTNDRFGTIATQRAEWSA